ncbi:uncharacterized protein [Hetaerina americana]|uniref:uncharacterized protein isoform X2 n=1 Tax=Hetaerina americana TaxID=62018 RepID=UPI003A7F341F
MEFFEIPSWDGDCQTNKLSVELFRSLKVPMLSDKKERKKHAKGSVIFEQSNNPYFRKKDKDLTAAKKNRTCNRADILHLRAQNTSSKEVKKFQHSPQSVEEGKSILSSIPPVKRKKQKKKQKLVGIEDNHGHQKLTKKILKEQRNDCSNHTIDDLPNKSLVNQNCDHSNDKFLLHLKKKHENIQIPNEKIKTKDPSDLLQSPKGEKRKHLHYSEHHNRHNALDGEKNKKLKQDKKKDTGNICRNAGGLIKRTVPHSSGVPSVSLVKKRKHSGNSETSGQKVKKIRQDGGNQSDFDSLLNDTTSSNTKVMLSQVGELHPVAGVFKESLTQRSDPLTGPKKKLTLREKMMEKLRGSRFRFLNEQIYTSKSEETGKYFQMDPESFEAYHEGYKQQLLLWPVKPVDIIIKQLKKKPVNYIIADFGCGDAQIAQSLPNRVYSFDHVALNEHVTVCDMVHTPLSNGSVDVTVFCLSLMGSNLSDYIIEANRVLKIGGILKIAEVESRFDNIESFIKVICKFGFLCISRDLSKDVFYLFDFKKEKNLKEGKSLPSIELRPCSYKKR